MTYTSNNPRVGRMRADHNRGWRHEKLAMSGRVGVFWSLDVIGTGGPSRDKVRLSVLSASRLAHRVEPRLHALHLGPVALRPGQEDVLVVQLVQPRLPVRQLRQPHAPKAKSGPGEA
eukprot:8995979-Pyramimonas_sp.AAC.1